MPLWWSYGTPEEFSQQLLMGSINGVAGLFHGRHQTETDPSHYQNNWENEHCVYRISTFTLGNTAIDAIMHNLITYFLIWVSSVQIKKQLRFYVFNKGMVVPLYLLPSISQIEATTVTRTGSETPPLIFFSSRLLDTLTGKGSPRTSLYHAKYRKIGQEALSSLDRHGFGLQGYRGLL